MSQQRWGRVRCRNFLNRQQIGEMKPVGTLTDRQRRLLAEALSRREAHRSESPKTDRRPHGRNADLAEAQVFSLDSPEFRSRAPAPGAEMMAVEANDPIEPTVPMVLQDRRNAEARRELLTDFDQIAVRKTSQRSKRGRSLNDWRRHGLVFGVAIRDEVLYPKFQFDENDEPRPVVERVLTALPTELMTPWEIALWWTSGNGWLDGQRPVDLMDKEPAAVVEAAAELAKPSPL
jgi:hypothetical protein